MVESRLFQILADYVEHRSLIRPFVCLLIYRKVHLQYQITEEGLRTQVTRLLTSQEIDSRVGDEL